VKPTCNTLLRYLTGRQEFKQRQAEGESEVITARLRITMMFFHRLLLFFRVNAGPVSAGCHLRPQVCGLVGQSPLAGRAWWWICWRCAVLIEKVKECKVCENEWSVCSAKGRKCIGIDTKLAKSSRESFSVIYINLNIDTSKSGPPSLQMYHPSA
jgi:hypothetical protein